jgi:TonB-dependent siderophore receptor
MFLTTTLLSFLGLMGLAGVAATGPDGAQVPEPARDENAEAQDPALRRHEIVDVEGDLPALPRSNVTALRTPAPLASTPVSVSVVPRAVLQTQGAVVLGDAARNASGVNVATGFGVHDFFVIRGFDSLSSGLVLTDGAPEPAATFYPLYNVSRVEVLKGPAAFLYGADPLAGAVHLVRKRPAPRRFSTASLTYGRFGTLEGALDANAGREDGSLAFRLNGVYRRSDAYRDDKRSSLTGINPVLAWRPDGKSRLALSLELVRARFQPDSGLPLVAGSLPPVPRTRSYQSPFDVSTQDIVRVRLDIERRVRPGLVLRHKLYYTDLDWQADGTLMSGVFPTPDGGGQVARVLTLLEDRQRLLGAQLEAAASFSTGSVTHHLLAGLELSRLGDVFTQDVALLPGIDLLDPVETAARPLPRLPGQLRTGDTRSLVYAPYVVDRVGLTGRLQLLAGGRLDVLDFEDQASGTERSDTRFSPLAGLVFMPVPTLSLYGSVSTGFAPPSTLAEGERVPEEARQFEVGLKQTFLGGRGMVTLAAYHLEKENIAIPDQGGFTQTVGSQRSRGLELELSAETLGGWLVSAAYALNEAELTEFADRALVGFFPPTYATIDRSGNVPAFAPRHILNLWATRRFDGGLTLGAGARYLGGQFIAEDNAFEIDDYLTLNAMVSYQRGRWRGSLNLENLSDQEYETRGYGAASVIPGQPFAAYARLELTLN